MKPLDVTVDNPVAPTEPALLEVTSHVQRFNYTRALFAKMEEETRRKEEKPSVVGRHSVVGKPTMVGSEIEHG